MATSSTQPVRIGVIGAGGRMRVVLRKLQAAAPMGRIVVTAAYDPDLEALAEWHDQQYSTRMGRTFFSKNSTLAGSGADTCGSA